MINNQVNKYILMMDSYINHICTQRQINSHKIKSVYTDCATYICLKYLNDYKSLKSHLNRIIILGHFMKKLK